MPSLLFASDDTDELIRRAFEAQKIPDYPLEESLLREAISRGRSDEAVLRGLAWALNHQGKHSEATEVALDNNRRNPGPFSVGGVCETYAIAGDYDEARKWLQYALQHRDQWGAAEFIFVNALALAAPTTYRMTLRLSAANLRKADVLLTNGSFFCPVPMTGLPYQTCTYQVEGAAHVEESLITENRFLKITPNDGTTITLTADVKFTPSNLRSKMTDFNLDQLSPVTSKYLKSSNGVEVESPEVTSIAKQLRAPSKIQTIENTFAWAHENIKYVLTKYSLQESFNKGGGGAAYVIRERLGHCEGQSSAIIALLRANGIPARFVRGYTGFSGEEAKAMFHTWVEYFVPSYGWAFGEIDNPPFSAPIRNCAGMWRYNGVAERDTAALGRIETVLYPGGPMDVATGATSNALVKRIDIDEKF